MKKLLVGLGAVIVLLVTAVIALPVLIPSDTIKEQISAQVRDATGRELLIDGEVSFSLVPNIEFSASDISLSNAAGMTDAKMLSLGGITVKIGLLPLLGREVVIDTLVIRDPVLHLEVDKEGRPNWAFKPAKAGPSGAGEEPAQKTAALPFSDLRLGDVRIENGLVSFNNASTGQTLQAKGIDLKVALADLGSPLSLTGRLTLNDEPVTLELSVKTPRDLLSGKSAAIQTALVTKHLTIGFDAKIQQQPVPGLDGAFKLDIASVGRLAAWLGQPLDKALPDPGPLKVRATFKGDGAKVALKQATIEGKGLKAQATGSFDGTGKIAKVVLNIETGVLDIDRYLPPARDKRGQKEIRAEPPKGQKKAADMLAALSDEPLDLSALSQTDADVRIAIGGIKVAGFEIGRVAFTTKLTKGVLAAELSELRLYGGNVKGKVKLDASGDALAVEAALTIDGVKPAKLARTATGGRVVVSGTASGSVNATARGASPRALAQSLRGKLTFALGGVEIKDAPVGAITDIKVAIDLPGLESPPSLKGSVIYNKQRVDLTASLDSLKKVMSGGPFAAKLSVATKHLKAGYDGKVLQQPVPGLDGAFKLDIASVGKLAAWLGQPLDKARPDPGPLKVRATFTGDGAKVALKQATIEGKGLKAQATGSFDGSGKIAKVVLNIETGVLDIDRYLPPARDQKEITAEPPKGRQPAPDMLAALSDEPLDLSALSQTDADVRIAIGGIKVAGFEIGRVAFTTKLAKGVLAAELSELGLYGGNVKGKVKLDGSGDALAVEVALTIDGVKPAKLARTATGGKVVVSGTASGSVNATARGASPRALAQSLRGKLAFALGGVEIKDAPVGAISDIKVAIDLPGLESPPSLKGSVIYNKERVDLTASLDSLKKVMSGGPFAAKLSVATKHLKAGYDGKVQQQPVPGLDGAFKLDVASVGKLAAWLGQPLDKARPDPGPLKLRATFTSDGAKVALKQATIEGKGLKLKATGSFDGSNPIPRFKSNIEIMEANLNAYLPPLAAKKKAPAKSKTGKQRPTGWSREPIDFSPLSKANGDIDVKIGTIRYKDLLIQNGRIRVSIANGVLTTSLEQLKLAQGTISATAKIDASKPAARIEYQASITGVESRKLLKTFADNDRLSGRVDFQTRGRARGRNQRELVESLNGDGRFKFIDGAIHGINLAATLRKAKTLGIGTSGGEAQKTDFAELSGSFTIKNGLLENRDFKMLAPLIRLSGAGVVPLPPQWVDYLVTAKLVASIKGQGGADALAGLPIPIKIEGPWSNVGYGVDWKRVFSQAMLDPERLRNMPADLRESAKGFGVDLPAFKIPGTDFLKGLFQPKQTQPVEPTKEQEAPPAPNPAPDPFADPLKALRGLFGR
ncbi:MAG: AsmA family protein [Proteobacteria bacterium]|nr:AsmA family protein [Pseudomonadota bacterium]